MNGFNTPQGIQVFLTPSNFSDVSLPLGAKICHKYTMPTLISSKIRRSRAILFPGCNLTAKTTLNFAPKSTILQGVFADASASRKRTICNQQNLHHTRSPFSILHLQFTIQMIISPGSSIGRALPKNTTRG